MCIGVANAVSRNGMFSNRARYRLKRVANIFPENASTSVKKYSVALEGMERLVGSTLFWGAEVGRFK